MKKKENHGTRNLFTVAFFLITFLIIASKTFSNENAGRVILHSYDIKVITYNVCGLPDLFTYDRNLAPMDKRFKYIGERLKENEAGKTEEVLTRQLEASSDRLYYDSGMVIAYEPVWAIGTGRSATGAQANDTIGFIRRLVSHQHGSDIASSVRILYGGSVTAANIAELIGQPEIDGALECFQCAPPGNHRLLRRANHSRPSAPMPNRVSVAGSGMASSLTLSNSTSSLAA